MKLSELAQILEGVAHLLGIGDHVILAGQHLVALIGGIDLADGDAPLAGGILDSGDIVVLVRDDVVEITEVQIVGVQGLEVDGLEGLGHSLGGQIRGDAGSLADGLDAEVPGEAHLGGRR